MTPSRGGGLSPGVFSVGSCLRGSCLQGGGGLSPGIRSYKVTNTDDRKQHVANCQRVRGAR